MTFTFDTKSQRFRWTTGIFAGQYMSRKDVEEVVEINITRIKADIGTITQLLLDNKISVAAWEDEMAVAIKQGAIQSFLAGKGGVYQLSGKDKNNLMMMVATEYQYLRRFSEDILRGSMSSAQIADRASKYADSFYRYYSFGRSEGHRAAGYKWERRMTTPGEVCPSCQYYASLGWQSMGMLPPIGTASECRMRCRCYFEYSQENRKPMQQRAMHGLMGILSRYDINKSVIS